MSIHHVMICLAAMVPFATPAQADIAFLEERCLDPFQSQANVFPIDGVREINNQGALFYQGIQTSAVLAGDLVEGWLRVCHVSWAPQVAATEIIALWQPKMQQLGLVAPAKCVRIVEGNYRVYAASDQPNG